MHGVSLLRHILFERGDALHEFYLDVFNEGLKGAYVGLLNLLLELAGHLRKAPGNGFFNQFGELRFEFIGRPACYGGLSAAAIPTRIGDFVLQPVARMW